jgi:Tfp pilus assembly protein PilF
LAENRDSLLSACHALANSGKWNEAIARLHQALKNNPSDVLIAFALANILNRSGDYKNAKELFNRIRAAAPDMMVASLGLANSLIGLEEIDAAIAVIKAATLANPQFDECYLTLGKVQLSGGNSSAAAKQFQRAYTLAPENVKSQTNLAEILSRTKAYDKAEPLYQAALAQAPDDPEIGMNYATHLIASGQFDKGWRYFEARLDPRYESSPVRNIKLPRWQGPGTGSRQRHLLVLSEQGIGDELRLGGALPLLHDHFNTITVECDPRLTGLIERSLEPATAHGFVRRKQGDHGHYSYGWLPAVNGPDCYIEVGSIPYALGLKLREPLNTHGYLRPSPDIRMRLAARLTGLAEGRKKVGIVWASGASNFQRSSNYPALRLWKHTLDLPNCCFFALQYGDVLAQTAEFERETGVAVCTLEDLDFRSDMETLAATLAELDLVIGVGTATTALAGAVGTKTIELASNLGWVPLLDGNDGLLGAIQCISQRTLGDWPPVMAQTRQIAMNYLANP